MTEENEEQVTKEETEVISDNVLTLSSTLTSEGEVKVAWAFGEGYKMADDHVQATLIGLARKTVMAVEELYSPVRTPQLRNLNLKLDTILNLLGSIEGIDQDKLEKTLETLFKKE